MPAWKPLAPIAMKIKIFFISLLICGISRGQNTWTQKSNYPDKVSGAVGFSIDDKGYIGLGWNPSGTMAFWKFYPSTNSWAQISNFPGPFMGHSVGFTINNRGYIGTGLGGSNTLHSDFWQYDSLNDSWTQKANFGGGGRSEATGFSLNGKGYIGTGWNQGSFKKDLWQYDPSSDQWIQKASIPGPARIGAIGFAINGKGYIGLGSDSSGFRTDLWEYNPVNDQWAQKQSFPSTPRARVVAFVLNNICYIGTGNSSSGRLNDFWRYNATTDSWTQVANLGTLPRQFSVAFEIKGKGYVGTGADAGAPYYHDFWEYSPDLSTRIEEYDMAESACFPNPFSSETILHLKIPCNDAILTIHNSTGDVVKQIEHLSDQIIVIRRENLPTGIYFVSLKQVDKIISTDKLVITDY
jgi:N-acetylneuraminic acid mutarotase